MIDNKTVMAKNIKRLMEEKNVNATEICEKLGIKHNTFSDWVNAKSYPRIDKIEMMARYFGVNKSELVEEHIVSTTIEISSNQRALAMYYKYLSANAKTRKMIDILLEEGD